MRILSASTPRAEPDLLRKMKLLLVSRRPAAMHVTITILTRFDGLTSTEPQTLGLASVSGSSSTPSETWR